MTGDLFCDRGSVLEVTRSLYSFEVKKRLILPKKGSFLGLYLCIGDYPKMGVLAYMSKKGPLFGHLLRGALKHRYFLEYLIGDYVGVFEFRPKPVKSAQKGGPKRSKNPDFGVLGPRSDCYI